MGSSGLGALLVNEGILTETDRRTITSNSGMGGSAFARSVLALGLLDEDELAALLATRTKWRLAGKELSQESDSAAIGSLDRPLLERLEVLPLRVEGKQLIVAMVDPLDHDAVRQIEFFSGHQAVPVIATLSQIRAGLEKLFKGFKPQASPLEEFVVNHAGAANRRLQLLDKMRAHSPSARPATDLDSGFDAPLSQDTGKSVEEALDEIFEDPLADSIPLEHAGSDALTTDDLTDQSKQEPTEMELEISEASPVETLEAPDLSVSTSFEDLDPSSVLGNEPNQAGTSDDDFPPNPEAPLDEAGADEEPAPAPGEETGLDTSTTVQTMAEDDHSEPFAGLQSGLNEDLNTDTTKANPAEIDQASADGREEEARRPPLSDALNIMRQDGSEPIVYEDTASDQSSTSPPSSDTLGLSNLMEDDHHDSSDETISLDDVPTVESEAAEGDAGQSESPGLSFDVRDNNLEPEVDASLAAIMDSTETPGPIIDSFAPSHEEEADAHSGALAAPGIFEGFEHSSENTAGEDTSKDDLSHAEEAPSNEPVDDQPVDDQLAPTHTEQRGIAASTALNRSLIAMSLSTSLSDTFVQAAPALCSTGLTRGLLLKATQGTVEAFGYWEQQAEQLIIKHTQLDRFITPGLTPAVSRLFFGWSPLSDGIRQDTLLPFNDWESNTHALMATVAPAPAGHQLVAVVSWERDLMNIQVCKAGALELVKKIAQRL